MSLGDGDHVELPSLMHGDLSREAFKVRIDSDETNKRACYGKEEKGIDRISWDLSCWAHNAKLRLIMIDLKNLETKIQDPISTTFLTSFP